MPGEKAMQDPKLGRFMSLDRLLTEVPTAALSQMDSGLPLSSYLTLAEYSAALAIYTVAFQFYVRLFYAILKRGDQFPQNANNELSWLLVANLVSWTLLIFSALPHLAWMIANWRPGVRWLNAQSIFWTTIVTECMMACIPYSLFFLSLDRIFAIKWLNAYKEQHQRKLLKVCILGMGAVFLFNMVAFYQIMPLPQETECNVFACLMTNGNTGFILSKLFGGVLILCTGVYLLLKLRQRMNSIANLTVQQQQQQRHKPETLVICMMLSELALNFLPQLIIFFVQRMVGHQIASDVGPINHLLNSLDSLVTFCIYRRTLRRFLDGSEHNLQSSVPVQMANADWAHRTDSN